MPETRVIKTEFLEKIQSAWSQWQAALSHYSPEEMREPGFCGEWSLEDVIAHITWYENEMVGILEHREFKGSDLWNIPPQQLDVRNAKIYRLTKPGTLEEKLTRSIQVHTRLEELVAAMTDDDLNDPLHYPPLPLEWTPWEVLAGNTYEHYLDHLKDCKK